MIRERYVIEDIIGGELGDAGTWDMLLELYGARLEQRTVFLWSLCNAAHVPSSTAHRKLGWLIEQGIVLRRGDLKDRRRTEVSLADHVQELIDRIFDRLGPFPA